MLIYFFVKAITWQTVYTIYEYYRNVILPAAAPFFIVIHCELVNAVDSEQQCEQQTAHVKL